MQKFSQILKDLCIDKGIKIFNLAELTGIDDGTLSKYANDISVPTVKNLVKLANYFECSLDYIIGLTDKYIKMPAKSEDKSLFYSRYESLLKEYNITHYKLTKILGFSISNLQNWKKGTLPYIETLIKLAQYLCVSLDYLVGRFDTK